MCGICGAFSLDGPLPPELRAALPAMTAALRHRGPDGDGFFDDGVAMLGHRRLAIIDRAGGGQPMANEDGSVWVVFNGEIYNHHDLRAELVSRGHAFRTTSDTETIVHGIEDHGPYYVDRLDGMFAFGAYNQRRRELLLARDRLGKKPIFYAVLRGILHFASEIKALYASPFWDPALDRDGLEGYLELGYFIAPHTIYRHVHKVEPGHYLTVRDGNIEVRTYWDIDEFDTDERREGPIVEHLEGLVRDAVYRRLESEVPLGAFLSGGIDSGLIVSFMAERTGGDVVTTSVGFGGDPASELDAAAMTARQFRTTHHGAIIDPNLEEVLDPIVTGFDEPFADSSAIPTWYVSRNARAHVTVALSGDGGDESFSGYDFRYVPHALECAARHFIPGRAGQSLMAAAGRAWPRGPHVPRYLRVATIFENLGWDAADAYYADLCVMKPAAARRLLGRDPDSNPRNSLVYDAVTAPYRRCTSASAVQRAEYADLKIYLPNDPLVKVDRMSMQHGLEVRCPLLDRRVVEFAFRVPASLKMKRLKGKYLLRALAGRRLPRDVCRLPKRGFTAPTAAWLAGPYGARFESEVLSSHSYTAGVLDLSDLRRCFEDNRKGVPGCDYPLWATWMFERWSRQQSRAGATG